MNNLEEELMTFAEESSVTRALRKLGILSVDEAYDSIRLVRNWQRGGAETYNLLFEVISSKGTALYIMKACTPSYTGISIQGVVERWVYRRKLLQRHGVKVPRLYGVRLATFMEDFIPLKLADLEHSRWGDAIVHQIIHYARVLSELGFAAINPFSDLMTDSASAYVVDFGEDLGEPYVRPESHDCLPSAINWLESLGIDRSWLKYTESRIIEEASSDQAKSTAGKEGLS
jgi:hypothetical protein